MVANMKQQLANIKTRNKFHISGQQWTQQKENHIKFKSSENVVFYKHLNVHYFYKVDTGAIGIEGNFIVHYRLKSSKKGVGENNAYYAVSFNTCWTTPVPPNVWAYQGAAKIPCEISESKAGPLSLRKFHQICFVNEENDRNGFKNFISKQKIIWQRMAIKFLFTGTERSGMFVHLRLTDS